MKTEILEKLLQNGWRRRQIAGALAISYGTIQKWSTGKKKIPPRWIFHLKKLPSVPPPDTPLAPMREQKRKY